MLNAGLHWINKAGSVKECEAKQQVAVIGCMNQDGSVTNRKAK